MLLQQQKYAKGNVSLKHDDINFVSNTTVTSYQMKPFAMCSVLVRGSYSWLLTLLLSLPPNYGGNDNSSTYFWQPLSPAAGHRCRAGAWAGELSRGMPGSQRPCWMRTCEYTACLRPGPLPSQLLLSTHPWASASSSWCWHMALRLCRHGSKCKRLPHTYKQISK